MWLWWLGCAASLPEALSRPNAVTLGRSGEIVVSDLGHGRVAVFDAEGRFVDASARQGLGTGRLWRVTALAATPEGGWVAVHRRPADPQTGKDNIWEVKAFREGVETHVMRLDVALGDDRSRITDLLVREDGSRWMASPGAGQVIRVEADGALRAALPGLPEGVTPTALAHDGAQLWVLDQNAARVVTVGPGGAQIVPLDGAASGALSFPSAIGVCPGAWVAIADLGNHRVVRFAPDGAFLDAFTPERIDPDRPVQLLDLAVTPDCERLVLADSKGDRVLVTTPTGELIHQIHGW